MNGVFARIRELGSGLGARFPNGFMRVSQFGGRSLTWNPSSYRWASPGQMRARVTDGRRGFSTGTAGPFAKGTEASPAGRAGGGGGGGSGSGEGGEGSDSGWSAFKKFILGGSAAGFLGYLFTFYMHPEVLEQWIRLIQYGRTEKTEPVVGTPSTPTRDASLAFTKLRDPEIREVLDRLSLTEAFAAMDVLNCSGVCDLRQKAYGNSEAQILFKLVGMMNGSSSERGPITSLKLAKCSLKKSATIKALRNAVAINRSLKELELRRCDLNDELLPELADAIKPAVWLTKLDLSENEFGDEGLTAFAQSLKKTTLSISSLILEGKKDSRKEGRITDDGAAQLAKAINKSNGLIALRELDLSHNSVGESGATNLLRALGDLKSKNGGADVKLTLNFNSIPEPSKAQLQSLAKNVGVTLVL